MQETNTEHEVMKGFNDWQTGIKFNEQQKAWLVDFLTVTQEETLSKTSRLIINQILAKLEK